MVPELAAWWSQAGLLQDPLQDWLGREQKARAAYKRYNLTSPFSTDTLLVSNHCAARTLQTVVFIQGYTGSVCNHSYLTF